VCKTAGAFMVQKRFSIPDPIAGKIEFPIWLIRIKDEKPVRRMLTIRQLGLKAYIDFPGAIHTRYSHVLGAMHLAGRVADILYAVEIDKGRTIVAENIRQSKDALMAAGFLHDIAHGPFSHAVDYALEVIAGKTHEELAKTLIREKLPSDLDNWVDLDKVIKIIEGKYDYPFVYQIINGPLDVDKLDYLLRDAHHVGLRYSFDLESFLGHYAVVGEESDLKKCSLGLEDTPQATVTAELFLVIWKSMYDLVYHAQNSRIAEKMLEKAVLLNKDATDITTAFTSDYLELNDDKLLDILRKHGGKAKEIVDQIMSDKLYELTFDEELTSEKFEMSPDFLAAATSAKKGYKVSDDLSAKINEKLNLQPYQIICDIVTGKSPQEIQIDVNNPEEEETTLRGRSKIVGDLIAQSRIKIYQDPNVSSRKSKQEVDTVLRDALTERGEF
jgi:HD superfamily phosphohydrolase